MIQEETNYVDGYDNLDDKVEVEKYVTEGYAVDDSIEEEIKESDLTSLIKEEDELVINPPTSPWRQTKVINKEEKRTSEDDLTRTY